MRNKSKNPSQTICILYGFCEGPRVAKQFRTDLEQNGYAITTDPFQADIILTHSGGCFLLPHATRAQRVIHVGIPFWPERSIAGSIWRKLLLDIASHHRDGALRFWLRKTFWNTVYFWNMPSNIRMLRGRKKGYLWRYGQITTVVRPELDTICTPNRHSLPFNKQPEYIETPGHHHDELWRRPKPYINIIVK